MKIKAYEKSNRTVFTMILVLLAGFIITTSGCTDNDDLETFDDNTIDDKFAIVDTDQTTFYNNEYWISEPLVGEDFYGQDANFTGKEPNYLGYNDWRVPNVKESQIIVDYSRSPYLYKFSSNFRNIYSS